MGISIITCVYNGADFIEEYWRSILLVDDIIDEIIIIDDGSTDSTFKLLNELKSEKLIIKSIKNSGPSFARNLGLSLAKSEYLLFLDIDDQIVGEGIRVCLNEIRANKDLDFVLGNVRPYSSNDVRDSYNKILWFMKRMFWGIYTSNSRRKIFYNNFVVTPGSVIVKREFASLYHFNENIGFGEDWELFVRYFIYGKCKIKNTLILNYRISAASLSHSSLSEDGKITRLVELLSSNFNIAYPDEDLQKYATIIKTNIELFKLKRRGFNLNIREALRIHIFYSINCPRAIPQILVSLVKFAIFKVSNAEKTLKRN